MFLLFSIFWNCHSVFPWHIGMVSLILGLICLWISSSNVLSTKLKKHYYVFCPIIRISGILLISWAWMEILANEIPLSCQFADLLNKVIPRVSGIVILSIAIICLYDYFLRNYAVVIIAFYILKLYFLGLHPRWDLSTWLIVFILAFIYSAWSIIHLGLRRSFFYSKSDDPLITKGPYQHHRHPQLLMVLIMIFASIHIGDVFVGRYRNVQKFG